MSTARRHGMLERWLHRFAFATSTAQLGIADLEERMFKQELGAFEPGPPVFITSLPRAGTTILLEVIAALPEFATHTYRDTPFVLCPMMWTRLSKPFRRTDEPHERAHGDGILISLDSPEAFEEMVWMAFWPKHYRADRIEPWTRCDGREFVEFFAAHRRKIIALRRREKPGAHRYVSKGNVNIARVPALFEVIRDATVIVPVRDPIQHAHSLLRQHLRFSEMHAQDAFARRYMAGIGHFDFGANLRPIDFDDWLDASEHRDPRQIAFWLDYWRAAYTHLARHADHEGVRILSFEALGDDRTIDSLADALGLANQSDLRGRFARVSPPQDRDVPLDGVPRELVDAVRDLHRSLVA